MTTTTLSIKGLPFCSDQAPTTKSLESLTSDYWTHEVQEAKDAADGADQDTVFEMLCRAEKCALAQTVSYKVTNLEQLDSEHWNFDVEFQAEALEPILIAQQLELGNTEALSLVKTFEDFEGVAARFEPDSEEFDALCNAHPELAEEYL